MYIVSPLFALLNNQRPKPRQWCHPQWAELPISVETMNLTTMAVLDSPAHWGPRCAGEPWWLPIGSVPQNSSLDIYTLKTFTGIIFLVGPQVYPHLPKRVQHYIPWMPLVYYYLMACTHRGSLFSVPMET